VNATLFGIGWGALLTALSIAGNLRRADARSVLTFPDFITPLVALAVFVVAFRWLSAGLDRALAGQAGRRATAIAAALFGVALGAFTWVRLPSHPLDLAIYTAVTTFIGTMILGYIGSLFCVRRHVRAPE
jgi:hypothetical protein